MHPHPPWTSGSTSASSTSTNVTPVAVVAEEEWDANTVTVTVTATATATAVDPSVDAEGFNFFPQVQPQVQPQQDLNDKILRLIFRSCVNPEPRRREGYSLLPNTVRYE